MILTYTKYTLKILLKDLGDFSKVAKFRLIWSHLVLPTHVKNSLSPTPSHSLSYKSRQTPSFSPSFENY